MQRDLSCSFRMMYLEILCVSIIYVYCTFIYCCSVQKIDLQPNVTRQGPWSYASSWPARPGSDGGTRPGASSHIACRISWCKRDCSPGMGRGEKHYVANTFSLTWRVNAPSINYFISVLFINTLTKIDCDVTEQWYY